MCLGVVLAAGLGLASASAMAANFYKFKDANGAWVISHNIPAERVKYGYLVVDDRGRVVQEVARQLTKDEYAEKVRREAALERCNEARSRVRNLYQDLGDIDHAEVQAIESIETSIANLRANLTHIRNQKRDLEGQAAQMDLAGQKLPPVLLSNIERARGEEENLVGAIDLKLREKAELGLEYDYDRAVFGLEDCEDGLPGQKVARAE